MSEPTANIGIRTGHCFTSGSPKDEVQNIFFKFDNGLTVSIGVGSMHYCTPRDFQGLEPVRSVVEIAVSDADAFITKMFFNRLDGRELHDDVVSVDVSQVPSILAFAARSNS